MAVTYVFVNDPTKGYGILIRYRINTEKMEIEQIWQYGKERGTSSSLRIFVM